MPDEVFIATLKRCLRTLVLSAAIGCWPYVAIPAAGEPPGRPAKDESPSSEARVASPAGRIREYVPGIRIDWADRTVLLDARVNLREGPLELFACSPKTREHESVVVVPARPLHIYQAMGLIGLQPGHPVRYDEKRDRWLPPDGERLDIRVQCEAVGFEKPQAIAQWLEVVETEQPPEVEWVFAGSRRRSGDRFAADPEGTVICVVDFDSALIAIRGLHTADNEMLWLQARTGAIPPVGTECTLLVRPAEAPGAAPDKPGDAPVETTKPPGDNAAEDGNDETDDEHGG